MTSYVYDEIKTPIGKLTLIGSQEGLHAIVFGDHTKETEKLKPRRRASDDPLLKKTRTQLIEYFQGKRKTFDLPLAPQGTAFQMKAWRALNRIPYGQAISYQKQAELLGDGKKARAVGGANGKNPLPIVVPCHRVVGKSGDLVGFGGGINIKKFLLDLEGWQPQS